MVISNVHNISVKSYMTGDVGKYPRVIKNSNYCLCPNVSIDCGQCATFWFQNVTNILIDGLIIEQKRPNSSSSVGGLFFNNATLLSIRNCTVSSFGSKTERYSSVLVFGLILRYSQNVEIKSLHSVNTVLLLYIFNITIKRTVLHSQLFALRGEMILICNTTITDSYEVGIAFYHCHNTILESINVVNPNLHGFRVEDSNNMLITDTSVVSSGDNSYYLIGGTNVTIRGALSLSPYCKGIYLSHTSHCHIDNTTVIMNNYSICSALFIFYANNTSITNTKITGANQQSALQAYLITNTTIFNTTVESLQHTSGIFLIEAVNTKIQQCKIAGSESRNALILQSTLKTLIAETEVTSSIFCNSCHQTTFDTVSVKSISEKYGVYVNGTTNTTFNNCFFTGLRPTLEFMSNAYENAGVVVLYQSTDILFSQCKFSRNDFTALRAVASHFTMQGNVTFFKNRAYKGAAIIFQQKSVMTLTANSTVTFTGNHVRATGAAIYVDSNTFNIQDVSTDNIVVRSQCILKFNGIGNEKGKLVFQNNTADYGGNILYGGQLGQATTDGRNCLLQFKELLIVSPKQSLSEISSQASRVCICNEYRSPNCQTVLDLNSNQTIYPGQTFTLLAVVVGQDLGTVTGSVFANFLNSTNYNGQHYESYSQPKLYIQSLQDVQGVTQSSCNQLSYTVYSNSSLNDKTEAILVLTAAYAHISQMVTETTVSEAIVEYQEYLQGKLKYFPQGILTFPVFINLTVFPCPIGFTLTLQGKCDCNEQLQQLNRVSCDIQNQTIKRSGQVWIGPLGNATNDATGIVSATYCPYSYCKDNEIDLHVNGDSFDSDIQCNYKRSGTLCGACPASLSVALGTNQCLRCSNIYLTVLLPVSAAGIVLVLVIKVLDLTVAHGVLNGLVFYFNIIHSVLTEFIPNGKTNILRILVAWTNLDLGIETCFFDGLTAYWKIWLQFLFPLYVWSISLLIIVLTKYFSRVAQVMGNNSVPVLATLFLLSYTSMLHTILSILSFSILNYPNGQKVVWSVDANIEYLGPKHFPLFATAVALLLLLWLPYTLILLFGQWLHKCNNRFIQYLLMKLKPFLDAYYGPLKGAHRYWFGLLLLLRPMVVVVGATVPSNNTSTVLLTVAVTVVLLLMVSGNFSGLYHSRYVSIFEMTVFSNLILLSLSQLYILASESENSHHSIHSYILVGGAFIQLSLIILVKAVSILKPQIFGSFVLQRCLGRHGSTAEDDWEPYEQAALLRSEEREREMQKEEETENLPFYTSDVPTYGLYNVN